MVAKSLETLLCPVCRMGKKSGTNLMGKHYDIPGVMTPCPGTGEEGLLPVENVVCFIVNVRFGLISMNGGVRDVWKWVCACGQHGAWRLDEKQAESGGERHVNGRKK